MVVPGMLMRICYCCGERLDEASPENPNICLACAEWPLSERGMSAPSRIVELVPVEDRPPHYGKPHLN